MLGKCPIELVQQVIQEGERGVFQVFQIDPRIPPFGSGSKGKRNGSIFIRLTLYGVSREFHFEGSVMWHFYSGFTLYYPH